MDHLLVLETRDGFVREDFLTEFSGPHEYKVRRYSRLDAPKRGTNLGLAPDIIETTDVIFYLKAKFSAMGKKIYYYKE